MATKPPTNCDLPFWWHCCGIHQKGLEHPLLVETQKFRCRSLWTSHGKTHGDRDLQLDVFHIYVSLQEGICFDRFSCGFSMFLPAYIVCPLLHDTEDSHEKGQLQKIGTLSNNSGDTVGISTMFVDWYIYTLILCLPQPIFYRIIHSLRVPIDSEANNSSIYMYIYIYQTFQTQTFRKVFWEKDPPWTSWSLNRKAGENSGGFLLKKNPERGQWSYLSSAMFVALYSRL